MILAFYVAGVALAFARHREPGVSAAAIVLDFSGQPLDRLPADLSTVSSVLVNPGQLETALRPDSPLQIAGRLPNLKRLVVFEPLKEAQLVELLQHQRLASLVLNHLGGMTDRGWAALDTQPLESLQILSMDRDMWGTGRWPLTVKTLLVQDDQRPMPKTGESHLEPFLRLPRLQTVKVRLFPDKDGRLRTADRDALLGMPSLKRLYIEEINPSFVRDVQKQLPGIAVRPDTYQPARVYSAITLIGFGFVPLMLILHVVSLQFVTPPSLVVPEFHRSHWRVAVVLILCCAFMQATALIAAGCHGFIAVGLSCVDLPLIWLIAMLLERTSRFPGFTSFPLVLVVFAAFPVFALLVAADEAESDWILVGHHPAIAGGLILLELMSLIGLGRLFFGLCRRLMESDEGPVPFGLWDMKGLETWNLRGAKELNFQERFWARDQQRRLSAALHSPRAASNHQSLLWRASHQMTAAWFATWMAVVMSVGVSVVIPWIPPANRIPNTLWGLWMQVTMFMWLIPFIRLMQQRPYLSRHLLATCGRQEWVRLIFRETARDYVPAAIATALGVAGYSIWGPAQGWPTWHVAALAISLLCAVYGISLLLVTFSPTMQAICFIGGFIALVAFFFIPLVVASQFNERAVDRILLWPPPWWIMMSVFAAVVIYAANRRWMNWELASIRA